MKNLLINPGIIKRIKTLLTGKYIENSDIAGQNIPAGKYVIWKNQMCRAKTAITTGDTLSSTNLDTSNEGAANENEWKLFTSFSGSGSNIQLPSSFTELFIKGRYYYGAAYVRTIHIPYIALTDSAEYWYNGNSSSFIEANGITKTQINALHYYDGGSDKTSSTTFYIYYR